jgi:hypothetical protein
MGDVVKFPKSARKNPPIVAMLESLLERAKGGELKFVAVAVVGADSNAFSAWTPAELEGAELTTAIGAVSFMHARFLDSAVRGAIDEDEFDEDEFDGPDGAA